MLARRFRRRHNIKTTLGQCLVIAGKVFMNAISLSREGLPPCPTPLWLTWHNCVMLRNITIRSWLRFLSPKIANFVLLKIDFWTLAVKGIAHWYDLYSSAQQAQPREIHVEYKWLCHVEYKWKTGWMRKHITCFQRANSTLIHVNEPRVFHVLMTPIIHLNKQCVSQVLMSPIIHLNKPRVLHWCKSRTLNN